VITRLLVANRGEIALRIIRTCRSLGISPVAVHSTVDARGAWVGEADLAVELPGAAAAETYLRADLLVAAAVRAGADAVHPGYGFLSEDPDFAEVCAASGLVFIGPPAEVTARLGDKSAARQIMAAAGLPVLPGSDGPVRSPDEACHAVARIGFPVIIKAVAGGGGRGMRVVHSKHEFVRACRAAAAEAQALFGDARVYLERYLPSARHIEVQVLCDSFGNAAELGLRDCSVQRRHQKLIEESPAPSLPAGVARRMGEDTVTGAKACGYIGAGTFEFLAGPDCGHYFMEANCRIQVEHPVTEMVTGIDLVQEQIKIAAGRRLSLGNRGSPGSPGGPGGPGPGVPCFGAALECRINMENPDKSFAPAPGRIDSLTLPGGPFIRVDTHGYSGYRMPAIYDSLLAKIIAWAPTRAEAIERMERALTELRVCGPGIATTAAFLQKVLADERFRAGTHDTGLVQRLLEESGSNGTSKTSDKGDTRRQ
jgi:acetyl-CoA carboxylase, biotin carboxylase subunit